MPNIENYYPAKPKTRMDQEYKKYIAQSNYAIVVHQDFKPVFLNQEFADLYGFDSIEQAYSMKTLLDYIDPDTHELAKDNYRRSILGIDKPSIYNYKNIDRFGNLKWILAIDHVVNWEGEKALQITIIDMTENVEAQQKLAASEQRFRDLVEGSVQGIVIHSDFKILFANEAIARLFGYESAEEFSSLPSLTDVFDPQHIEDAWKNYHATMSGAVQEVPHIVPNIRKDGSRIWIEIFDRRIQWMDEWVVQVTVTDVTAHHNRETLSTSLYNISNAIHTTTSLDQLYGSIQSAINRIIEVKDFSIIVYDKDTDSLNVDYTTTSNLNPGSLANASRSESLIFDVIKTGEAIVLSQNELEKNVKNTKAAFLDSSYRTGLAVPLKGSTGVLGVIVIQNDSNHTIYSTSDIELLTSVSAQIAMAIEYKWSQNELASVQKQLIEKAHEAGMAEIAGGTLHNVGNILNSINTSVQTMSNVLQTSSIEKYQKANQILAEHMGDYQSFFSSDPKAERLLSYYLMLETDLTLEYQEMQASVNRLISLVNSVTDVVNSQRNFTGRSLVTTDMPLTDIVDEALSMMDSIIQNNEVEIVKHFQQIPPIELQKSKLIHIIINLLRNSVESMIESNVSHKKVIITIDSDDTYVQLSFEDNGIGIPPENLIKIFNHGFTTKKSGYGFGLHSCANYMDEMKGSIKAQSDGPGNGATFILEFPIY